MENREIKFRGLTVSGKWVYGLLARPLKAGIFSPHVKADHWYISNSVGVPFAFEVRPETVGQYTGLKDADGVESYQDDRVECLIDGEAYGEPDIIGFEKGAFWLRRRNRSMASWLEIEEYQGKEVVADFRVIGNIHESPPPAAQ